MSVISENLKEKLTPEQVEMRDHFTGGKRNKDYWEKRWKEDPDSVCRDLENLYRTAGSEFQELIVGIIDKKFSHFESVFVESSGKMMEMIQDLRERRRDDRAIIDRHESEIQTLKHATANNGIQLEQTRKIIELIHDGQKLTNENVAYIRDNMPKQPSAQQQKSTILSSIPAIAWPVIGVVSIAIIAALAGQMPAFISWLGTIKIFGGA